MAKFRVYLDMDNVLVDFDRGAAISHGCGYADFLRERELGKWDIRHAIAKARQLIVDMSLDEFWHPICQEGPTFWEQLKTFAWTEQLLAMLANWSDDILIVSTPSHCPQSIVGKMNFCNNRLAWPVRRFIPIHDKYLLAKPNTVLIDDKEENVEMFKEHSGQAILFPHKGNSLHREADYPLYHVVSELKKLEQM